MSVFSDAPRLDENALAFVVADSYPLSAGHVLVCPKREVTTLCDLDGSERDELWDLVERWIPRLRCRPGVTGLRVMINEGLLADHGPQHIPHLHVHLIPWYAGMKP